MIQKKLELEHKWAAQAMTQNKVTPDMKWIDIDIKKLKTKINDQCVKDVKVKLELDIED